MNRSILNQSGVARSEQWRMKWAFRTAISIACVAFICLYSPTKKFITRNGQHLAGPPFAGLVIGMAKDRMFGGTFINCWSLLFSCFITCSACWIIILIINETTAGIYGIPDYVLVCIIFVLVLFMQCLDLPPLGKKFMCSIVPLLIISIQTKIPPADVWYFQVDTIIATGCALVGNVIPLPIEFSSVDLQKRTSYVAHSSTVLLTDLFKAWQYQSCFNDSRDLSRYAEIKPTRALGKDTSVLDKNRLKALRSVGILKSRKGHHKQDQRPQKIQGAHSNLTHRYGQNLRVVRESSVSDSRNDEGTNEIELPHQNYVPDRKEEHKYWRKVRLTLMCAIQFKLNRGYGLGWYFSNNSCGSKYLRMELVKYLRDGITDMVARNVESKFASISPLRCYLFSKYAQFATLLREVLSICSILEDKISLMEDKAELNYIYRAFHNIPKFRHALDVYCRALCTAIETISDCLTHSDREGVHPTQKVNHYTQASVVAIATLLTVRQHFDKVYYECRQSIYYEHIDNPTKTAYRTETAQDTHSLPLVADVLLNMNSFLFLADALCNQIQAFWSPNELAQIEIYVDVYTRSVQNSEGPIHSEEGYLSGDSLHGSCWYWWLWPTSSMTTWVRSVCMHGASCIPLLKLAALDLFPSQVVAFQGFSPKATPAQRQAAFMRLKSAFSVAFSMSIASAYGIYLERNQAFLAAFTIAFLAGGPAAGVTMVTSLNRAAGTVVACVVAVITKFFLESAGVGVNDASGADPPIVQQLVLGIVVVLFQIPATIVRSYPLQGYAGTCASFTICIILLAPNLDSTTAIDRIIDTFVGVVIYLVVEAVLSTTYTENILLTNMKAVYEGIDERFAGLQKNFFLFKNYARSVTRNKGHATRHAEPTTVETSSSTPCLPLYSLNGLHVEPVDARIKVQFDLLRFLDLDPGLRRPPPMPANLVEECVSLQVQAVKHLQVMYWAIKSCADADTDPAVRRHQGLYHSLHRKVQAGPASDETREEAVNVSQLVVRQIGTLISGNSVAVAPAPATARAPRTGPYVGRSNTENAAGIFQFIPLSPAKNVVAPTPEGFLGLFETPTPCASTPRDPPAGLRMASPNLFSGSSDGDSDGDHSSVENSNVFHFASTKTTKTPAVKTAPTEKLNTTSRSPIVSPRSDRNSSHSARTMQREDSFDTDDSSTSGLASESQDSFYSPPVSAKPPKFMLLTLEKSFVKVGRYVSLVCTFLQMSLQDMERWQEASAAHAKTFTPTGNSLRNVNTLNEARVSAHTDFLLRSVSLDAFRETDAHLLTKLETQQVVALFSGFQGIVEQLLSEVVNSVATTVVLNGKKVRTSRQNKEVKVVNAMIASTLDLLRALKGLAATMSKMQAHRDIRVTQSGDRFI